MVVAKSSGEYQNNFCGFVVIRKKISSLKIYCWNIALHELESRMHVNGSVWHLQGKLTSFDPFRCICWDTVSKVVAMHLIEAN